jgi:hypothetical protein
MKHSLSHWFDYCIYTPTSHPTWHDLPACYPLSPLEYRVLDVTRDLDELLNLATGSHAAAASIAAISHLSALYA